VYIQKLCLLALCEKGYHPTKTIMTVRWLATLAPIRELRDSNIGLLTGYCYIFFVVFVSFSISFPRRHIKLSPYGFLLRPIQFIFLLNILPGELTNSLSY